MSRLPDQMREALWDPVDVGLSRLVELNPPRDKVARAAWLSLLADASLGPAAVAAIEGSGALEGELAVLPRFLVADLVRALGAWRFEPACSVLQQLWASSRDLGGPAGRALLRIGTRASLEVVAACLDDEGGRKLGSAIEAVFAIDATRAWERVAPHFASPSVRGGIVLEATLHVLMRDISDDGKQHWGPARGWFSADPRWLELCGAWRPPPPPALREQWGAKNAQKIVEVAAWLRKRAA